MNSRCLVLATALVATSCASPVATMDGAIDVLDATSSPLDVANSSDSSIDTRADATSNTTSDAMADTNTDAPSADQTAPMPCSDMSGLFPPTGYTNRITELAELWAPMAPSSLPKTLSTRASIYRSLRFSLTSLRPGFPAPTTRINLQAAGAPGGGTLNNAPYVSISTCPGDFRPPLAPSMTTESHRTAACRKVFSTIGTQMSWHFVANPAPDANECNLDPSLTYYMNVITDTPDGGFDPNAPDNCVTSLCGFNLSLFNID